MTLEKLAALEEKMDAHERIIILTLIEQPELGGRFNYLEKHLCPTVMSKQTLITKLHSLEKKQLVRHLIDKSVRPPGSLYGVHPRVVKILELGRRGFEVKQSVDQLAQSIQLAENNDEKKALLDAYVGFIESVSEQVPRLLLNTFKVGLSRKTEQEAGLTLHLFMQSLFYGWIFKAFWLFWAHKDEALKLLEENTGE